MAEENKVGATIAFFDFDGTLVKQDSFFPFLYKVAGQVAVWSAIAIAVVRYPLVGRAEKDFRTFMKAEILQRVLRGKTAADFAAVLPEMKAWVQPTEIQARLKLHYEKGHKVVVASGGLDVYLPALLEGLPYDDLICTKLSMREGVCTGFMEEGNCVRVRKAELVGDYIKAHGPFDEIWAYGNHPHDLPMMQLATFKVVV